MIKESPYDTRIKSLEEEANRVGTELAEEQLKRAIFLCPFEMGDILVDRKGKRAKIVKISSAYRDYRMDGAMIRKDGTPGRVARLYDWDDWKKEEQ